MILLLLFMVLIRAHELGFVLVLAARVIVRFDLLLDQVQLREYLLVVVL